MIIKLLESELFTIDPAIRFAREYKVDKTVWHEMWRRHLFHEYDLDGLRGYFLIKTNKAISAKSVQRWLLRSDVYCRANHIIRMGQRVVDTQYFKEVEPFLIKELTRNMRFSGHKDSKTIL